MTTAKTIKPYANNPKLHPDSQLEALFKIVSRVGWRVPVLVNQDWVIVSGHGRWAMYEKYKDTGKIKDIWAIDDMGKTIMGGPETTPLSKIDEQIYRIADNALARTDMEMGLLTIELKEIYNNIGDISETGYDNSYLEELNIDDFFEDSDEEEKKPKTITCPDCGKIIEL